MTKIAPAMRPEVLRLHEEENLSPKDLAGRYGVAVGTIYRIIEQQREARAAGGAAAAVPATASLATVDHSAAQSREDALEAPGERIAAGSAIASTATERQAEEVTQVEHQSLDDEASRGQGWGWEPPAALNVTAAAEAGADGQAATEDAPESPGESLHAAAFTEVEQTVQAAPQAPEEPVAVLAPVVEVATPSPAPAASPRTEEPRRAAAEMSDVGRKASPIPKGGVRSGNAKASVKMGVGLVIRDAEGTENIAPFPTFDLAMAGCRQTLRQSLGRNGGEVWISVREVDLAELAADF